MSINSRRKGKNGELELAKLLRGYGYDARRSVQYSGANGDADLTGLDYIHIECKRVEKLNLENAVDQSIRDARDGEVPTVFHRKNNREWLVTMRMSDWMQFYQDWRLRRKLDDLALQKEIDHEDIH